MTKEFTKVRVAKSIAIDRIKKYYEKYSRTTVTVNEISKLLDENKIPREVCDDTIAELLEGGYFYPLDSKQEGTIVMNVPPYLAEKANKSIIETSNIVEYPNESSLTNFENENPKITDHQSTPEIPKTKDDTFPRKIPDDTFPRKISDDIFSRKLNDFKGFRKEPHGHTNVFSNQFPFVPQQQIPIQLNPRNQIKVEKLVDSIPSFSGEEPGKIHEFVSKVDNLIKISNPEQHELLCTLVKNKLTGNAEQLVRHLNIDHWPILRGSLLNYYVTRKAIHVRIQDLGVIKQGNGTVTNFASDLLKHKAGLFGAARTENIGNEWVDHLIFKTFILNLRDDLKVLTMARNPPDFDTAFQIALGFEADCIPQKKRYCSFCKSETHNLKECRNANKQSKNFVIRESDNSPKFGTGGYRNNFLNRGHQNWVSPNSNYNNGLNNNNYYNNPRKYDYEKTKQHQNRTVPPVNNNKQQTRSPSTFTNKTGYNNYNNFKSKNNQSNLNYNRQNTSGYLPKRDNAYQNSNSNNNSGNNFYKNSNGYRNNENRNSNNRTNNNGNNNISNNNNKSNSSNDRVNLNQVRTLTPTVVMGPTL